MKSSNCKIFKRVFAVALFCAFSVGLFAENIVDKSFSLFNEFNSLKIPVYISFECESDGLVAKGVNPKEVEFSTPSFYGEYVVDESGRQVFYVSYKKPTEVNANYIRAITKDKIWLTHIPSRKLAVVKKEVSPYIGRQSYMDFLAKVPDDDFTYPTKTFAQLLQMSRLDGNKLVFSATENGFKAAFYVDKRDAVDKRIKIMDMYVFDFIGTKTDKTLASIQHRFLLTDFFGNEIESPVVAEYIYSDFAKIKNGVKIPKKIVYNMNVVAPKMDEQGKILSVRQKRVFWQTVVVKEISADKQKIAEKSCVSLPKDTRLIDEINSTAFDVGDIVKFY